MKLDETASLYLGQVCGELPLPEAEEHEVVGGVGVDAGGVERLRDARVHHLDGVALPEEHLLDRVVRRDALGVHRDHHVHREPEEKGNGMKSKDRKFDLFL